MEQKNSNLGGFKPAPDSSAELKTTGQTLPSQPAEKLTSLEPDHQQPSSATAEPKAILNKSGPGKQGRFKRMISKLKATWSDWSRRKKIVVVTIAVLILTGIITGLFLLLHKAPKPAPTVKKTTPVVVKPVTVASPLSGLQVAPALAKRPVTGIMIENSTDARPQSGLQDAGVVFEAVAEGGITRFLALFQDTTPQYIGPVRSVRPYYIDFAQPFQASIVHVGGSPTALARVRDGSYRDLDQFFNAGSFTRVTSRAAPHNVYTSFDELDKLNQSKGYTTSTYTSWVRKAEAKLVTPTAKTIDLAISSYDFNVHYLYDLTTNTYIRSEGGVAHTQLAAAGDKTAIQLAPKVVIALVMASGIDSDGQHTDYVDTGSGNAYIFQDGGMTPGKWNKADAATQITFTDTAGAPVKLNPGQTWLSLVSSDTAVTYAP